MVPPTSFTPFPFADATAFTPSPFADASVPPRFVVFPPKLNRAAGTAPVIKAAVILAFFFACLAFFFASLPFGRPCFFFGGASFFGATTADATSGATAADSLVIHQGIREGDDKEEDE